MQKLILYLLVISVIVLITLGCIGISSFKNRDNIEFLKSYGWEVSKKPIEIEEITIPKEFDEVYKNYNLLQIEAGLNLLSYRGKTGTRYTYEVLNYPIKTEEQVRANVIVIENTPVAGDIMTVNLDGFMHSLYYIGK